MKYNILKHLLFILIHFVCNSVYSLSVNNCDNNDLYDDKDKTRKTSIDIVDLGLSVGWASCNIGASTPEDYGDYFSWGEIETKRGFYFLYYKYYDNDNKKYTFIGNDISLSEYDVATATLGSNWRMPTSDEFKELIDSCVWEWIDVNETYGYKVTGPNGNSIFLPASGRYEAIKCIDKNIVGNYWSSVADRINGAFAFIMDFCKDDYSWSFKYRYMGCPVRPVSEIDGGTNISDTNVEDKNIVYTTYYNINGYMIKQPQSGNFYIQENTYADGSKRRIKVLY